MENKKIISDRSEYKFPVPNNVFQNIKNVYFELYRNMKLKKALCIIHSIIQNLDIIDRYKLWKKFHAKWFLTTRAKKAQ